MIRDNYVLNGSLNRKTTGTERHRKRCLFFFFTRFQSVIIGMHLCTTVNSLFATFFNISIYEQQREDDRLVVCVCVGGE